MLDFQLFRIHVFLSPQRELFSRERTRPQMLREVIESLPSGKSRRGLVWRVGNVDRVDQHGLYFRIGRTYTTTVEVYDENEGRFVDQEFETAPYTHVVVDLELEVCAIAKKTRLSPTTFGIARQLVRLLNESQKALEFQASFEIDDLKDPEDFIAHLRRAHSISKFWITFSRPNAFDAEEDIIKPLQKWAEASKGEKGKAELKGQNLDADTLEKVARSAAATGNNACAWLKTSPHAKKERKLLSGNPVSISVEDVADDSQKRDILLRIT